MKRNNYSSLMPAFRLSVRAALSAGLAVAIAELVRLPYPIYALIGAVIVSDLSPAKTRQLGFQRLMGSVLGAAVGAVVSLFLPPAAWTIGLGVLIAMFLSHLVHLPAAAKLAGYVCGIVVIGYSDDAWFFGFYRLIETILGIGMSVLVSFVPKLTPGDEATPQKS